MRVNDAGASMLEALTIVDVTGSTNDDARALAIEGAPHGTAVASRAQTAGRGRRGHVWESPEGGLYLSVVLRPPVPMQCFVALPIVCCLGVLDALRGEGFGDVSLKWPNDVLRGARKLGGVLGEGGSSSEGPFAVIGVGLNVARTGDGHGSEGLRGANPLERAYLYDVPVEGCVERLAQKLRDAMVRRTDEWACSLLGGNAKKGPLEPVISAYKEALPLLGRPCRLFDAAGVEAGVGVLADVDAWGRATVLEEGGGSAVYSAEQISIRPLSEEAARFDREVQA